jgi:hypothetical protein
MSALRALAQDIVAFVEVKVDPHGAARVVLHLTHQFDTDSQSLASISDTSTNVYLSHLDEYYHEAGMSVHSPTVASAGRRPASNGEEVDGEKSQKTMPHTPHPSYSAATPAPKETEIEGMLLEGLDHRLRPSPHSIYIVTFLF